MSEERFPTTKIMNEAACCTITSPSHSTKSLFCAKQQVSRTKDDTFTVFTVSELRFWWGDSMLHCNYVLLLRELQKHTERMNTGSLGK